MLDKILVGAAVWMISSETGRKTASKAGKILVKIGGLAVESMPGGLQRVFTGLDDIIRDGGGGDETADKEGA